MPALGAALFLAAALQCAAAAPAVLTEPAWDFVPAAANSGAACVDAGTASGRSNARWVYYALPAGTPPATGWPIWLSLVTDNFAAPKDAPSGNACSRAERRQLQHGWGGGKTFGPFATPNATMASCFEHPPPPPVAEADGPLCRFELRRVCRVEEREGDAKCMACAGKNQAALKKVCTQPELEALCNGTSPSPSPYPPHTRGSCDYDQQAGAMWDQRLKQYLLANGVAVVVVNPFQEDSWDAGPWWWGTAEGGGDQALFGALFPMLAAGKMGRLDLHRTVIRGWSGGAQMVSWLMQVIATNSSAFPDMTMKGGVMLSGGSYNCYNDPNDPNWNHALGPAPQPTGSCGGCTEGGPNHCDSATDSKCDSCVAGVQTYCQQCCPKNYTEQHYLENPGDYSKHPPVFLAQTSKSDNHADLCACKNYYSTLVANGVTGSQLVLMLPADEKCFCIGNPAEPSAAGSPYAGKCDGEWGGSQVRRAPGVLRWECDVF